MASKPRATNDYIRDLIEDRFDKLRQETKSDLKDIYTKIDDLDKTVSDNALKQAVSSTKIGMLITGITLVVSATVTAFMNKVSGRI
jgi:hypothetical protein